MHTGVIPQEFFDRLRRILPDDAYRAACALHEKGVPLSVRVNTLKSSLEQVRGHLDRAGIGYAAPSWYRHALVLRDGAQEKLEQTGLLEEGIVYRQGLSSMVPALVLDPQPGERVLDLCAAPGSKTGQMAAMMDNSGQIMALEVVRGRYYKLREVLRLLGVRNTTCVNIDARRFKSAEPFDKVLIDAPCSSEGRFRAVEPKTYAYWSPAKIRESAHKQRGLLLAASRLLTRGGVLVYATCTFAPEENEATLDWFLRKAGDTFEVTLCERLGLARVPALMCWEKRAFDPRVSQALRIAPTADQEGFFVARMIKRQ